VAARLDAGRGSARLGYRHTNQATHIVTNICSIVNVFFLVSRAEVTQGHPTTPAVLTNYLVGDTVAA
jgi:hypothetical protein